MTRRSRNSLRTGLAIVCLLILTISAFVMAATPAGTKIQATATAQYKSSSGSQMPAATSNTVIVTVGQTASVGVSPATATKQSDGSLSASYGLTVTNNGGGSDTYDLTATAKSGSKATIYLDANGDGVRQSAETTVVSATTALSAGGTFKVGVVVQLPSTGTVTTDTVMFVAKSRADTTKTAQSVLTIQKSADNSYIQSWLINGYYPNSALTTQMSTDYIGGEANVAPTESSTSGGKVWTRFDSTTPYVNLWTKYGKPLYCAGYAFAYINSPSAQTVTMLTGSDDGIKVWLNGAVVQTKDVQRSYTGDIDTAQISLNVGWNKMLVKVTQKDWDWGFSVRILDSTGNAVQGLQFALAGDPAGGGGDTTPPTISTIKSTPGTTTATVEWDTNEPSTTLVSYGPTSALGTNYTNASMVTHHTAALTGLTAGTTYSFKVGSADASGNTAWSTVTTFKTTTTSTTAATYIQTWLLNGYYANATASTRMTTDYIGGEANVGPTLGAISGGKAWTKITSTTPYINLWTTYGKPLNCAGYGFAYVNSPIAQTVYMKTGSDDGIKVWVNGVVVLTKDVYRSYVADAETTQINLNAGWNRILVKATQGDWDWGFAMKLCDSAGYAAPGLTYALAPVDPNDTTPPAITNVKTTPGSTSATIEWDTDEPSSTLLDYGITSSLGRSYTNTTMVTHHVANITSLTANTTYYVKVGSADANGNSAWNGPTTVVTSATTAYIQTWLINGYYPNSTLSTQMSTDYLGGEASINPTAGTLSGGKTWTKFASTTPYVNLWTNYGKPLYCAGYAFARVYSPSEQMVYMKTGSDDGIKVWLNGAVVQNRDVQRGYTADIDTAQINLTAGWNSMFVKLTQKNWDWGFSIKLCDSTGKMVPGLAYSVTQ